MPDPRRRQGRRYPLASLLGLLILASLQGETSLRGMWLWAQHYGNDLWWPLGFGSPHVPALTTLWNLLGVLDADAVDRLVNQWLNELPRSTAAHVPTVPRCRRSTVAIVHQRHLEQHTHIVRPAPSTARASRHACAPYSLLHYATRGCLRTSMVRDDHRRKELWRLCFHVL